LHMQHGLGRRPLATVLDARGIQLSRLHALTEWSGQPTRGAFGWVVRALGRGARYTSGARSPNKAQAAEGPCRLGKGRRASPTPHGAEAGMQASGNLPARRRARVTHRTRKRADGTGFIP
jgi:hypothetical protein